MPGKVNGRTTLRDAQVAETERRIIAAATPLFAAHGYTATSLTEVARAAGVGARTVYVRFGTKAALFNRVVETAIVGDTAPVALLDRDVAVPVRTAPTAAERIAAAAAVNRGIMERTGPLFAAAREAEPAAPEVAALFARGREQTRAAQREFWTRLRADRLLPPGADLDWLTDTAAVLCGADTYLLVTRMYGWDLGTYQAWLETTLRNLAAVPA
ncbi:TetR family transcriptional regulator [Prauserella shujinwangii]|uniref:TetR family transcriptional regulator n=1 Tax=Prauserella shujinwangii TaxID=1453103 RepID=A0A2T0LW31_9PSEU|nr:TetR/AcrR family transcriptional regulator [Prauserella shujinwangii]PRX48236.1 TetR family transcriptional regulator [Prauserella shujinwangii]